MNLFRPCSTSTTRLQVSVVLYSAQSLGIFNSNQRETHNRNSCNLSSSWSSISSFSCSGAVLCSYNTIFNTTLTPFDNSLTESWYNINMVGSLTCPRPTV
ncbi:hypothetical protein GYMLUDRAFT_101215 [Collybiopsis luxurians FD-317 M1]|uniref:Uncharacterized protein n=1 Tax=Collybiopsis luxurians FD-317 M1 TaxID=944289 RepID=A0A0D0C7N2_9AGAR|nr:hypothetical protein GYMLUDRAFT_101215 [Collybiopsis luxurians FD-317 M1]